VLLIAQRKAWRGCLNIKRAKIYRRWGNDFKR